MSLATFGWSGCRETLYHQVLMGERLRGMLAAEGWRILNSTPLPVVCFDAGDSGPSPADLAAEVRRRKRVWISTVCLGDRTSALRACITNPRTLPGDLDALAGELASVRRRLDPAYQHRKR